MDGLACVYLQLEETEKVGLLDRENIHGLPVDRIENHEFETLQLVSQLSVRTKCQQMNVKSSSSLWHSSLDTSHCYGATPKDSWVTTLILVQPFSKDFEAYW